MSEGILSGGLCPGGILSIHHLGRMMSENQGIAQLTDCMQSCHNCVMVGSGGLMVRAPACRSRGRWFDSTSTVSKLGQFRSTHFACVFLKRQ